MILVSFCRNLNGVSDEINLFLRCSFSFNKPGLHKVVMIAKHVCNDARNRILKLPRGLFDGELYRPFKKRHKLVHYGGFPKFEVLYFSQNTVKFIRIQ